VTLEGVARAFGLTNTATVGTPQALEGRLRAVLTDPGPSLTVVTVAPGAPVTPLLPLSATTIAQRFLQAVIQPEGIAVS
jgi:thiamine pyrophosphate-dependent acetolactate synthase large subunit-like protein